MHVTLVHAHVKPEHLEAFIAATRRNHEDSVREPGITRELLAAVKRMQTRAVLA